MKNTIIIISIILSVSLAGCKKKGCTDCSATNYNSEAKLDDNSCVFTNEEFIGVYAVKDSLTGPPTLEWFYDSYELEITKSICSPNNLLVSNYANKNNTFNGAKFTVNCQVINNEITINEIDLNGFIVRDSKGHFSNDSIYFDIEYENEFGEVFFGKCFGNRK